MKILFYEFDKTVIKNKGIFLILLAVILKLITLGLEEKETNAFLYENRAQYLTIVNSYSGKITDTLSAKIEDDYGQVNQASDKLLELRKRYNNGEVSENEYRQKSRELEKLINNKELFLNFYSQFVYAREKPEERYLLYSDGWNALLSRERLDWAFVLLIVVFAASIYGREYDAEMRSLLISTKKGDKPLIRAKSVSIFMTVILLSLLSSALEYVFFQVKYGLPHGDFPLQSLSYFQDSSARLSLNQTFLAISAYRLYGLVLLAAITMLISVLTQKMIAALTGGLMSVIIPYALPVSESIKYLLPTPLGFILGQGYFRGTKMGELSQADQTVFQAISPRLQFWMILGWFLALILMLALISRKFGYAGPSRKSTQSTAAILLILVCFSGCAAPGAAPSRLETNFNMIVDNQSAVVGDKLVTLFPTFLFEDLRTHQIGPVILDPFLDREFIDRSITSVYSMNGKLYYATKTDTQINITQLDLKSWQSKVIYTEDLPADPSLLNNDLEVHSWFAGKDTLPFFIHGNDLFILSDSGLLQKIRLPNGRKETLITNVYGQCVAFNGEKIYYINNLYELRVYDLASGKDEPLGDIRAVYRLILRGDKLYYPNLDKEGRVYALDLKTNQQQEVLKTPADEFFCDDNYIYFKNPDDHFYLYRADLETGTPELLVPVSNSGFYGQVLEGYPAIYYWLTVRTDTGYDTEIYRINKETWTYEKVEVYDNY